MVIPQKMSDKKVSCENGEKKKYEKRNIQYCYMGIVLRIIFFLNYIRLKVYVNGGANKELVIL